MNAPPYVESTIALSMFQLFPPSIYKLLISDFELMNKYGVKPDSEINIGEHNVSFRGSVFFKGIKKFLANSSQQIFLKDTLGCKWQLMSIDINGKQSIKLMKGDDELLLPNFSVLAPCEKERLNKLNLEAEEVNLPEPNKLIWEKILTKEPFQDDDLDEYHEDLKITPVRVAAVIRDELFKGKSKISSLVPSKIEYYERLVGEYTDSVDIEKYSKSNAREHIAQLLSWKNREGLLFALLLSSHSFNVAQINLDQISNETLVELYKSLCDKGDLISKLGAIEAGLLVLDKRPELESFIKEMIEQIRDDDTEAENSRFKLLSALIVLVEGEISRTKVLIEKPPFWRRLASIAQASLIERCVIESGADIKHFSEWAINLRGSNFYYQTISDLRIEPRWQPDLVSSSQLKAEFSGRIATLANGISEKINNTVLYDQLFTEKPGSILSHVKFPFAYMPGPLEGGFDAKTELPEELLQAIEEQLSEDILQPKSFFALINSALIYKLDPMQSQIAAKTLRAAKYRIRNISSKEQLFSILSGLATLSAVTRSYELAEELNILIRKSYIESGACLTSEEVLILGLITAASYSDLKGWCGFIGGIFTYIAFHGDDSEKLKNIHNHLKVLCNIVPELWLTCGKADAALSLLVD